MARSKEQVEAELDDACTARGNIMRGEVASYTKEGQQFASLSLDELNRTIRSLQQELSTFIQRRRVFAQYRRPC